MIEKRGRKPEPENIRLEKRAKKRKELLDAAISAIKTFGLTTSMDQIAAEAGVTKPILYRHFGHKDGLLQALERRYEEDLVERLAKALTAYPPNSLRNAKALLQQTIDTYVSFVSENEEIYKFLTRNFYSGSQLDQYELTRRLSNQVSTVMRDGFRQANLNPYPAELWSFAVVGMVHASADWWVSNRSLKKDDVITYLTKFAWKGFWGILDPRSEAAGGIEPP
jgi:AcrR family transcriptional regulator